MSDSWRDEPLTKGDMYDALIEAANILEKRGSYVVNSVLFIPYKHLMKLSLKMSINVIRDVAETISGKPSPTTKDKKQ